MTQEIHPHIPREGQGENYQLSNDDRQAMRAYLQRCEVRISTMHRIATSFVSGAGLLLLVPVFLKDALDNILIVMLNQMQNQFVPWGEVGGNLATGAMYFFILAPVLISMWIPLYGLYLLMKDIIHFYFSIYTPGLPEELQVPTFSLMATSFSSDESPQVKREVMRYEYLPDNVNFMIPFSEPRKVLYFDSLIENTKEGIIPSTRQLHTLERLQVLGEGVKTQDVQRFNAALGITGSLDRNLVQEVAITEMVLVRNVLFLRRLVLRYVKVLMMFLWTMVVAFLSLPLLRDERFPTFIVLAFTYLIWSSVVRPIILIPIDWIYQHRFGIDHPEHIDAQLTLFETNVMTTIYFSIVSSVLGLLLALTAIAV
jgi:hypothetical protein